MIRIQLDCDDFLNDTQGRKYADVVNDSPQAFDEALDFFSDDGRQQRMEDSEIHHDRPPLAGVVRELEAQPKINEFLSAPHVKRNNRFRQAVGVLVRIIMEKRGWQTTGKKGSLGVRAPGIERTPAHNTGGLAFWFLRAERYLRAEGMPYRSVRVRNLELDAVGRKKKTRKKRS